MIRMRLFACVIAAAVFGCHESESAWMAEGPTDAEMVSEIRQTAINRAIVTQSAVYPFHFHTGTADLNELGQHDLGVLAAHHRRYPNTVHVRRGGAPKALYDARVAAVLQALVRAGVDDRALTISDGMPGGDGLASPTVVDILTDERTPRATTSIGSIDASPSATAASGVNRR